MLSPDDLFFLAMCRDGSALVVITPAGTTRQNQLLWLFGVEDQPELQFMFQQIEGDNDAELDFTARYILDELRPELEEPEADRLDDLIEPFGLTFPSTRVFSDLARASLPHICCLDDPDAALVDWMDREEQMFRRLERRIVAERIQNGFHTDDGADVDGFLSFSLSVQNRRKSRVGSALENNLEEIFTQHRITFARGAETENRNRPDFLFPGQEYRDESFPSHKLAMLDAKSTVKDRWRQVLSEARRIEDKHLLTLELGISENQTDEMRAKRLQLVVPRKIQATYRPRQLAWLMDVSSFLALLKQRAT